MRTTFISLAQSVNTALHTCTSVVEGIISLHKNNYKDPARVGSFLFIPGVENYQHASAASKLLTAHIHNL